MRPGPLRPPGVSARTARFAEAEGKRYFQCVACQGWILGSKRAPSLECKHCGTTNFPNEGARMPPTADAGILAKAAYKLHTWGW